MTHEELKKCIGEYRELKKDLWWSNRWGVQKIEGYNFGIYYNDFAGHWQFSWNDPENEHRVADIEDIFETKEDAEEYAEFGNITRTERLELPSWEEFNSTKFSYWFMGKNEKEYHLHNVADEIYIGEKFEIVFNKPLTRENYNEARRICVKLFKGEEIDGKTNNQK